MLNISITSWLNTLLYTNTFFDKTVYIFAEYTLFVAVTIFIFAFMSNGKLQLYRAAIGFAAALGSWLVSQGLNVITSIERPFVELSYITPLFTHGLNDSFPSGHSVIIFALAFYAYRYNAKVGLTLLVLSILSGIARVTAGIHWVTDILGSIILAYVGVLLVQWVYARISHRL